MADELGQMAILATFSNLWSKTKETVGNLHIGDKMKELGTTVVEGVKKGALATKDFTVKAVTATKDLTVETGNKIANSSFGKKVKETAYKAVGKEVPPEAESSQNEGQNGSQNNAQGTNQEEPGQNETNPTDEILKNH